MGGHAKQQAGNTVTDSDRLRKETLWDFPRVDDWTRRCKLRYQNIAHTAGACSKCKGQWGRRPCPKPYVASNLAQVTLADWRGCYTSLPTHMQAASPSTCFTQSSTSYWTACPHISRFKSLPCYRIRKPEGTCTPWDAPFQTQD